MAWLADHTSVARAEAFIAAFESVLEDLRAFPELGEPELNGRTRMLRRAGYRFRYVIGEERLIILRITNPRRG